MQKNRTHYEQVPIEMVIELVEAEVRREQAAAANQENRKLVLDGFAKEAKQKSEARARSI